MHPAVQDYLLTLNRRFYEQVAPAFAETRSRPWPGFAVAFAYVRPRCPVPWSVLDVGCGNGRLLQYLGEQRLVQQYVGVDANATLLANARPKAHAPAISAVACRFLQADIATADWPVGLAGTASFDVVACLATLHHLPGLTLRQAVVQAMARLLRPGGYLVLSNWQPFNSQRERGKVLDTSAFQLAAGVLEEGDFLISWKREVAAVRYVHVLSVQEVCQLAAAANLTTEHQFLEDGSERNLNLYSILCRTQTQESPQ